MEFDHDRLIAALGHLEESAHTAGAAHAARVPVVPHHAAGQAFAATADRLQAAVGRLHRAGQVRIEAMHVDATVGARQVRVLAEAEAVNATRFRGEAG